MFFVICVIKETGLMVLRFLELSCLVVYSDVFCWIKAFERICWWCYRVALDDPIVGALAPARDFQKI